MLNSNKTIGKAYNGRNMNIDTFDWSDIKALAVRAVRGDSSLVSEFNQQRNYDDFTTRLKNDIPGRESWYGYSLGQLERWLTEGYHTTAISDLSEFTPPIREKRKLRFNEEGDEFHFDIAASGGENYMSEWTKRESIPGISVEIEIGFTCSTDAEVVNAYNTWVCRVLYSLEAAGIDCEIMVNLTCDGSKGYVFNDDHQEYGQTRIVVKRENELTDFVSFSPMLSPAAVRSIGFATQAIHADSQNRPVCALHGYWDMPRDWGVSWNAETSKLYISCLAHHPTRFPEDKLNTMLRTALREMMRSN